MIPASNCTLAGEIGFLRSSTMTPACACLEDSFHHITESGPLCPIEPLNEFNAALRRELEHSVERAARQSDLVADAAAIHVMGDLRTFNFASQSC